MQRARKKPKAVPWTSYEEWKQVYEDIVNPDSNCEYAIRRIETWSHRGNLPVCVEMTLCILSSKQYQYTCRLQEQHALAMAFIRFVNGILDQQQNAVFARAISKLAEEIGFPQWFVELRHHATHSELPSVELLRLAFNSAFEWILENYWQPQLAFAESLETTIKDSIKRYLTLCKEGNIRTALSEFDLVCNFVSSEQIRKLLLKELIESKLLNTEDVKILAPLLDELVDIDSNFLISFFESICDDFKNPYFNWCVSRLESKPELTSKIERMISKMAHDPKNRQALDHILSLNLELSETTRKLISPSNESSVSLDHSIEEMAKRIKLFKETLENNAMEEGWVRCENWAPCPFGLTPYQKIETLHRILKCE